jgi:hypothetical protein
MLTPLGPPANAAGLLAANGSAHPLTLTADPAPADPEPGGVEPLGAGWTTVSVVIGIMAALIALGGMVLSFRAVSAEMLPAFGDPWARLVPVVVDLTVFVFSGVDLVLARLDMSHPLARWTVYGATAGTVWLNYSAGGNAAGRTAHVLMPSIWVVFIELMRHVVRRQTNLATGSRREPIPAVRWLLAPGPTFLLFRRMALWRVHSYTRALQMERTRLGAVATARALYGRFWRRAVGPLLRLEIGLGEADAATITAAHAATARPNDGQGTAEDAATARPVASHDNGQDAAKPRPPRRPTRGQDTAAKVAKTAARHPEWSARQVAEHLAIGERTARRHMTGH